MSSKAERPPSERTPERELADRIDELVAELRNAERRPGGSWWDQLPAEAAGIFGGPSQACEWSLPSAYPYNDPRLRLNMMPNCVDLSLLGQNLVFWQRRLFFGAPASP